jgi:hypothetical protein
LDEVLFIFNEAEQDPNDRLREILAIVERRRIPDKGRRCIIRPGVSGTLSSSFRKRGKLSVGFSVSVL